MTLRRRLVLGMLAVVAISGSICTLIGGHLLWRALRQEARSRVRQDLNAAREFYRQRLEAMADAMRYTALGERFSQAIARKDVAYLSARLGVIDSFLPAAAAGIS